MFFGQAVPPFFSRLMSTHPPLSERISRIAPNWNGRFSVTSSAASRSEPRSDAGFSSQGAVVSGFAPAASAVVAMSASNELLNSIGGTDNKQVTYAQNLLASLPASVLDAASEPYGARALVYCLLLDSNEAVREKQW